MADLEQKSVSCVTEEIGRQTCIDDHLVIMKDVEMVPSVDDILSAKKSGKISNDMKACRTTTAAGNLEVVAAVASSSCKSPRSAAKKRKYVTSSYKSSRLSRPQSATAVGKEDSVDLKVTKALIVDSRPFAGRKKRQRRRKNRRYKPYNKLSWQERSELEDRETRRANRVRALRFANGQPVAPYNTTQFLIEDHNDLKEIDVAPGVGHQPPLFARQRARTRDSSFSVDSDDEFYYSTPEDEKEFLTKEFSTAYEDLHAEELNAQPKSKLVQEILNLEKKLDVKEQELSVALAAKQQGSSSDELTDEKVLLYKAEITKLSEENNKLRAENECLRRRCSGDDNHVSTTSVDSDSDSTAATSTGSCSSSCSSDQSQCRSRKSSPNDQQGQSPKPTDVVTLENPQSANISAVNSPSSSQDALISVPRSPEELTQCVAENSQPSDMLPQSDVTSSQEQTSDAFMLPPPPNITSSQEQ